MRCRRIGNKGRPACPLVQGPENPARLFRHYEMAAPAMFAGPSSEQNEELLKERHQFLITDPVD